MFSFDFVVHVFWDRWTKACTIGINSVHCIECGFNHILILWKLYLFFATISLYWKSTTRHPLYFHRRSLAAIPRKLKPPTTTCPDRLNFPIFRRLRGNDWSSTYTDNAPTPDNTYPLACGKLAFSGCGQPLL